jgi:transcriptional regulator with XRE-family HTH domain
VFFTFSEKGSHIIMEFKDRLKERRRILGISQAELAKKVGITGRTVQNYELGTRNPQSIEIAQKLAEALETTVEYLLGTDGLLIADAYERGGAKTARDINALVSEISGLFAGGEIGEDEKDGIMAALNQAYWMAKENNKKYTPKKYKS